MGVVDVDGYLIREDGPVFAVDLDEIPHGIAHGGGGEEILLLQPQLLAFVVIIVGIEHLGDDFRQLPLGHGLDVLAGIEGFQVDSLGGPGGPQAQHVHHGGIVAHHGHVVGHCVHGGRVMQAELQPAVFGVFLQPAAKLDVLGLVGPGHFPHVAAFQPVIGHFHLIAVHDLLAEQAVFIADGTAHGGQLQGGKGIQEAGGQAAQTAVAQAGLGLDFKNRVPVDAQVLQGGQVVLFVDQVHHIVVQRATHQEFGAEIIDLLRPLALASAPGSGTALHHLVPHGLGQGQIQLLGRGVGQIAAEIIAQFGQDGSFNLIGRETFEFHGTTLPYRNNGFIIP